MALRFQDTDTGWHCASCAFFDLFRTELTNELLGMMEAAFSVASTKSVLSWHGLVARTSFSAFSSIGYNLVVELLDDSVKLDKEMVIYTKKSCQAFFVEIPLA